MYKTDLKSKNWVVKLIIVLVISVLVLKEFDGNLVIVSRSSLIRFGQFQRHTKHVNKLAPSQRKMELRELLLKMILND